MWTPYILLFLSSSAEIISSLRIYLLFFSSSLVTEILKSKLLCSMLLQYIQQSLLCLLISDQSVNRLCFVAKTCSPFCKQTRLGFLKPVRLGATTIKKVTVLHCMAAASWLPVIGYYRVVNALRRAPSHFFWGQINGPSFLFLFTLYISLQTQLADQYQFAFWRTNSLYLFLQVDKLPLMMLKI